MALENNNKTCSELILHIWLLLKFIACIVPIFWRDALRSRIILRKVHLNPLGTYASSLTYIWQTLLQLMQSDIYTSPHFRDLIDLASSQLKSIRSHPIPTPEPSSPAYLAFDPYIGRHLRTLVPLRIISLPSFEKTWKAIDDLLGGWKELTLLSTTHNLSTWEVMPSKFLLHLPDFCLLIS